MRVVLMPPNVDGTGYYRCLFPGRELRRRGHATVFAPHAQHGHERLMLQYGLFRQTEPLKWLFVGVADWLFANDFDVLFMGFRDEPEWAHIVPALQRQGKRVVVDIDDDILNVPAWNPGSGKSRAQIEATVRLLAAADAVSVTTPALADLYGRFNENITVIRNSLDWRMWADVEPVYERRDWSRPRVGWMGHARWRKGDLDVLKPILGPWLKRNPEVEFVAAGDPSVHDYLAVPKNQRVSTPGVEFWQFDLPDVTCCFDIGLVPLAKVKMNEGKSHLKGMEYNACGIPYVASPTESYEWWTSGNGLLADKREEWWAALDELVANRELRERMGRAGRELARDQAIQERVHEWEDFLTDVCGADRDAAGTLAAA